MAFFYTKEQKENNKKIEQIFNCISKFNFTENKEEKTLSDIYSYRDAKGDIVILMTVFKESGLFTKEMDVRFILDTDFDGFGESHCYLTHRNNLCECLENIEKSLLNKTI